MIAPIHAILPTEEAEMARRRWQQGSWVASRNMWLLEFRRYTAEGSAVRETEVVGLRCGPDAIGKREAEKRRTEFMERINLRNRQPSSGLTVAEFVENRFKEHVVSKKKPAGQKHYKYCLGLVLPLVGQRRLCDFGVDDVESLMAQLGAKGYSAQTVVHARNTVSAIFRHARKLRLYDQENPAALAEAPTVRASKRPSYGIDQLRLVMARLRSPHREMALTAVATSMGPAEMCGLTLRWCNLTPAVRVVDGEILAPFSLACKENWYEGKRGSLKSSKRERVCPITPDLASMLAALVARAPRHDDDAPLFQSRNGTPIDCHNISNKHFRPLSRVLGFPVTWYAFRRAHSTLAAMVRGLAPEDRQRGMGHAHLGMSMYYSVDDVERRRAIPASIMAAIEPPASGRIQ